MKLERYTLSAHEDFLRREMYVARATDPGGRYMDSAKVDALLASIRAAVDAEREARDEVDVFRSPSAMDYRDDTRAALDALLGGEE